MARPPYEDAPIPAAEIPAALRRGLTLLNQGRVADAQALAHRITVTDASLLDAWFLSGLALQRGEDHAAALDAFAKVIEIDPENAAGHAHRAESLLRMGRYAEAEAALEPAARFENGNPVVQQVIAMAWSGLSKYDQALPWFRRSVERAPGNSGFLLNLANCEMYCGELDQAAATLDRALTIDPAQPNLHWLLSVVRKAKDRQHVDTMRSLAVSGRYPPRGLALLHYASGKEFEDLKAWDEAFDAFAAGAAAQRSAIDYDEDAEERAFAALEESLTRDWLDDGRSGHDDPAPIFIVGQPRSGTTLVERIIAAHSRVHSAGELRQFGDCLANLTGVDRPARISPDVAAAAADVDPAHLGENYVKASSWFAGGTERFVDKQPGNFLYLPLILKALPSAKVIHLRRSPMDTCFSVFKQLFTDAYPYSYDLAETARHYGRYYRLMDTWRQRFGERFFEVDYEKVAADPEPHTRAVLEFLGLPFEPGCLSFHEQSGAVTTASAVQVRKPAHTGSIGRWRRYEQALEPLAAMLREQDIPLD